MVQLKISNIFSGNGLSPVQRQAITWSNIDENVRRNMAQLGNNTSNDCFLRPMPLRKMQAVKRSYGSIFRISFKIDDVCLTEFYDQQIETGNEQTELGRKNVMIAGDDFV